MQNVLPPFRLPSGGSGGLGDGVPSTALRRSNFSVHSLRGGEQSTLFEGAQGDSWERLTSCQAQTGAVSKFKRVETTALEGD